MADFNQLCELHSRSSINLMDFVTGAQVPTTLKLRARASTII